MSTQPHNPLHGITLEQILNELVAHFGWPELGQQVNIRCFTTDPSVPSSLKFLRRTPWAREKVESLYLFMLREQKRRGPIAAMGCAVRKRTGRDRPRTMSARRAACASTACGPLPVSRACSSSQMTLTAEGLSVSATSYPASLSATST